MRIVFLLANFPSYCETDPLKMLFAVRGLRRHTTIAVRLRLLLQFVENSPKPRCNICCVCGAVRQGEQLRRNRGQI